MKPEDIVKELMERKENHQQQAPVHHLKVDDFDKIEEPDSEDIEQEDEDEDEDEDDDDDEESDDGERKRAYKIEFQRQKAAGTSANEGGNGASSFLAMVQ